MLGNMLNMIAQGLNTPAPGDPTDFSVLPDRPVGKGDTWIDSIPNRKTVYTLADITPDKIIVNYTETQKTTTKQEAMGMEISIQTTDNTTGQITLDRKTGLLQHKTATTDSDGTMSVAGQSMPATRKTTREWTVE